MDPEEGGIYRIRSRNLPIGAYAGNGQFIGIREKFGYLYLDSEWLNATVSQVGERVGTVPEGVALAERDPESFSSCQSCGKRAWWTGPPAPAPWACESGCEDVSPLGPRENRKLRAALEEAEERAFGSKRVPWNEEEE